MLDQKMSSGRCLKSWINLLWDFFSPPSLILFVFDSERNGGNIFLSNHCIVFSFDFLYMICKFDAWTNLELLKYVLDMLGSTKMPFFTLFTVFFSKIYRPNRNLTFRFSNVVFLFFLNLYLSFKKFWLSWMRQSYIFKFLYSPINI